MAELGRRQRPGDEHTDAIGVSCFDREGEELAVEHRRVAEPSGICIAAGIIIIIIIIVVVTRHRVCYVAVL